MSCIHYQFKSAMDYKTLTFEGSTLAAWACGECG